MKWIFTKENEEHKIILRKTDGADMEFSYVDMIKELYEEKKVEPAEFEGDFSEGEQESVNALVDEINKLTSEFFERCIEEQNEIS